MNGDSQAIDTLPSELLPEHRHFLQHNPSAIAWRVVAIAL